MSTFARSSSRTKALAAIAAVIVLAAVVSVAIDIHGGGSGPSRDRALGPPPPASAGRWVEANANQSNTRAVGGPIDAATVTRLKLAWSVPLEAKSLYGAYAADPVILDGVVYSQDLASNVTALSLDTGRVLWAKRYDSLDNGPNGVVVADGRVYGATASSAFALSQATGRQLWSVSLTRNAGEGIDMAPAYQDGIVYVSTVPGNQKRFYAGNGVGILWALDAASGRRLWHFDTAPEDLWSAQHKDINSGGGLWYSPAFDGQGSMYIGVGNPGPFVGTEKYPWGSSRPGPDLYTDSLVVTVLVPADANAMLRAFPLALETEGPVYMRIGRSPAPVIHATSAPMSVGSAIRVREGSDVTIIATGVAVARALAAAASLAAEGISCEVIDAFSIKPLDRDLIVESAARTGGVVTAEDHSVIGGLGGAVAELLVCHHPVPVEMVGVNDRFGSSGAPEELAAHYGIDSTAIAAAARRVLERRQTSA
jgi:hypothetical protein